MKKLFLIGLCVILMCLITSCASLTLPANADMSSSAKWSAKTYVDSYGLPTNHKYVQYVTNGKFSNVATTSSSAEIYVVIDEHDVRFKIYEYGSYLASGYGVDDMYYVTVDNDIRARAYNGSTYFVVTSGRQDIVNRLAEGKTVSFRISGGKYSTSTYTFKVEGKGFADKYSQLLTP